MKELTPPGVAEVTTFIELNTRILSTGELQHFYFLFVSTQPMLQCARQFLTEFVSIVRFYSLRLFRQWFVLLTGRQCRDSSGVCGNNLYKTLSCLNRKFCFFIGIFWSSKQSFRLHTVQHDCSHPHVKGLLQLNFSGCPSLAQVTPILKTGQKPQPSLKHIMEIALSSAKLLSAYLLQFQNTNSYLIPT